MSRSTTIKTKFGDVTFAAFGECRKVDDGPEVRLSITLGVLTTPVTLSAAQARGVAQIFSEAATTAELAHQNAAKARGIA